MLVYNTHWLLHMSLGRADRWFRWGIVEMATGSLMFLIATRVGPAAMAIAWCCSYVVLIGPSLSYAGKPIDLPMKRTLSVACRFLACAAVSGFLCFVCLRSTALAKTLALPVGSLSRILASTLAFISLYLGILFFLPYQSTFAPIVEYLRALRGTK
jgi:hypothetical protein